MDLPLWFRVLFMAVGSVLSLIALRFVVHSIRRLNRRIAEFEAELEARQGAPLDPYSVLAEIYSDADKKKDRKRGGA